MTSSSTSSTDRFRRREIRARMAETGEPYSEAARALKYIAQRRAEQEHARARTDAIVARQKEFGEDWSTAKGRVDALAVAAAAGSSAGMTPPPHWAAALAARFGAIAVLRRDHEGSGVDHLEVVDHDSGDRLGALTVPHRPAAELFAEYVAAGLRDTGSASADAPAQVQRDAIISLGRPDLTVRRLGYDVAAFSGWQEWPDGSFRSPAEPSQRPHTVTATRLDQAQVRLVVVQHPDDWTLLDTVVTVEDDERFEQRLTTALDANGFTVRRWDWRKVPGDTLWATARPGRLAERPWWTSADVRIIRQYTAGAPVGRDRTYRVGDVVHDVHQSGRTGEEVDRDSWWTSTDIDSAHVLPADHVEVITIREHIPPTWAEAALTAEQVTELLAPHHPGAAAAAATWAAAGIHVSLESLGLVLREPAGGDGRPGRRLGAIGRDYWKGNACSKPYEAVLVDDDEYWRRRTLQLDVLPADPVIAARQ